MNPKTKARFGRQLRPPAWKWRVLILVLALHKFVTYLLTYSPGTHIWLPYWDQHIIQSTAATKPNVKTVFIGWDVNELLSVEPTEVAKCRLTLKIVNDHQGQWVAGHCSLTSVVYVLEFRPVLHKHHQWPHPRIHCRHAQANTIIATTLAHSLLAPRLLTLSVWNP